MNPITLWARERENIRLKKESGQPPPWSDDVIFRQYRFCNVHREDDKVTRWIAQHWRNPNKHDPDLWFAMVIARHLNLPDSLAQLGYPIPWKPKKFLGVVRGRRGIGMPAFNAAYMIRASNTEKFEDKAEYLVERVFNPLWKQRKKLRPVKGMTLEQYHTLLQQQYGLGSFLAGQTVSDLAYTPVLQDASDWWEFAASGPGSRRGLNLVLGREINAPWAEQVWREEHAKLRAVLKPEFEEVGLEWVHSRDSQNLLCEGGKYLKVRLGLGRPKQRYNGGVPSVFTA